MVYAARTPASGVLERHRNAPSPASGNGALGVLCVEDEATAWATKRGRLSMEAIYRYANVYQVLDMVVG